MVATRSGLRPGNGDPRPRRRLCIFFEHLRLSRRFRRRSRF
jgi:hypothetical protein